MKKFLTQWTMYFVAMVLVFTATISCDEDLFTLKVPVTKEFEFRIDSINFKSSEKLLFESQVSINLDSLIKAYGGDPEIIKKGQLKSVTVKILEPANLNFNFITSLRVNIQRLGQNAVDVATAQNSTLGSRELTFVINQSQDALDYLKQGSSFFVRLYGIKNAPMPVRTGRLSLKLSWELSVKVL